MALALVSALDVLSIVAGHKKAPSPGGTGEGVEG
jgi:hypothetical protein